MAEFAFFYAFARVVGLTVVMPAGIALRGRGRRFPCRRVVAGPRWARVTF